MLNVCLAPGNKYKVSGTLFLLYITQEWKSYYFIYSFIDSNSCPKYFIKILLIYIKPRIHVIQGTLNQT